MEQNAMAERQESALFSGRPLRLEQYYDPMFLNGSADDATPSYGGHGTLEILEITQTLEKAGITCCIVGISALIYYGAGRGRRVSSKY